MAQFGPLNIPSHVHDLPENYLKLLPKYNGEPTLSVEEHLVSFQDFTDNLFMEHDNVFMRLFVQTLEGYVHKWFRELPTASIDSWQALESAFMKQWGEKRDNMYYLTEFGSLKKKSNVCC
jgi:hypothetical protein